MAKRTARTIPTQPDPPSTPVVVNEIVERGFVPSPDEYELLSSAVHVAAHAAREAGNPAIYTRLQTILGRLAHTVQAPGGLKPDQIARYQTRADEGLKERDSAKLAGGVQDLIAATCRTDPDPGDKVAVYLLQLVAALMREHGNMGIELLGRLDGELGAAEAEWEGGAWPTAKDVLVWIRRTIQIGIENLQADRDPWPVDGDEDEDEDDDEAGQDDDVEGASGKES